MNTETNNDRISSIINLNPGLKSFDGFPSILNVSRDPSRTTERYKETDDLAVLELLNKSGWYIKKYQQVRAQSKNSHKSIYKPYLATFYNDSLPPLEGEGEITLLRKNAKDGTKCDEFYVGFLKWACLNGLVAGTDLFEPFKIKHVGDTPSKITELTEKVIDTIPTVRNQIEDFQDISLNRDQQAYFASEAIKVRFGAENTTAIKPEDVLYCRRQEDNGNSLWQVMNRVQENLIRSYDSFKYTTKDNKQRKVKGVSSIDLTTKINTGLWDIAAQYIQ